MARFQTDAQAYGSHMSGGFNPDGGLNPHDVMHTGPGQFKKVGRFDPLSSSVAGGIFGGGEAPAQHGNVAAIHRVKARPTGGGDFLDRLALAEARDDAVEMHSERMHAAGARPASRGKASPRPNTAPNTAYARAAKILDHHQSVADGFAQRQQQRQWTAVQKQGGLCEVQRGRDGGAAAGAKSRSLLVHEQQVANQAATMQQSWQQQARHAEEQKHAEQRALQQQQAARQQQQAQREAMQMQQRQRMQELHGQSAMAMQMEQHQQHQQYQQQQQQRRHAAEAQREVAMKTQWAHAQAQRMNGGQIRLG